jgi:peptidoglycan/xylan/chitin deacetylase (PgdA/CDA1 family)
LKIRRNWYHHPVYVKAKQLGFEALYRSGALKAFRYRQRNSVLVLIYHDVLPPGYPEQNPLFGMTVSTTEFEWQLDYLQKNYSPITFEQFSEWFHFEAPLPPRPVLLTFDDGHRNNLRFALPLLQRRGMSAVFFVVTGNLGREQRTWFEDAYFRLMLSSGKIWRLRNGECLKLETEEERRAACARFFTLCRGISAEEQEEELAGLRKQLPLVADNGDYSGRFAFLSVEELQDLRSSRCEIGAHTRSHPILSTLSRQAAGDEIKESKLRLERELCSPIRAFAYPFGAPELDFKQREREMARENGFSFAFAGEGGLVSRSSDPFSIPRMGVGRMSRAQFAAMISGATETLRSALLRKN